MPEALATYPSLWQPVISVRSKSTPESRNAAWYIWCFCVIFVTIQLPFVCFFFQDKLSSLPIHNVTHALTHTHALIHAIVRLMESFQSFHRVYVSQYRWWVFHYYIGSLELDLISLTDSKPILISLEYL